MVSFLPTDGPTKQNISVYHAKNTCTLTVHRIKSTYISVKQCFGAALLCSVLSDKIKLIDVDGPVVWNSLSATVLHA